VSHTDLIKKPVSVSSYDSRTADKFVVRLPDGLRERINEASELNHRSMNGEIVARISGSLDLERKYDEVRQLNHFLNERVAILNERVAVLEAAALST